MIFDIPLPWGYALGAALFVLYLLVRVAQIRRERVLQQRAYYREQKALHEGWEPGV